ncbi:hypothetical protein HMPREF9140_00916 [Prevotella micans F0438]|uniref:Uncharacterized protein n=1 Tax=Prevotella micans F0438 TaxID=883158 RepID=H1Q1X8_9BACT|nr:hypothetical protein [Prevotella micans]EHO71598.1 hypothetical protein HMPREF9140_00916 [Prevotella micans F0438]
MKQAEQTQLQIERFVRKIIQKFPQTDDLCTMTDIHIRASQESGDLMAFDDDDEEITRCVVDEWIENKSDNFNNEASVQLQTILHKLSGEIENMGIMKPFSFVLEDDEKENVAELFLVDDDIMIVGNELMSSLEDDLNTFLEDLLKKE